MVRLKFSISLSYQIRDAASDFVFNIHAARTRCQSVVSEALAISQSVTPEYYTDPAYGTRFMRLQATTGPLVVRYDAMVDIAHHESHPDMLAEMPGLSSDMLAYRQERSWPPRIACSQGAQTGRSWASVVST